MGATLYLAMRTRPDVAYAVGVRCLKHKLKAPSLHNTQLTIHHHYAGSHIYSPPFQPKRKLNGREYILGALKYGLSNSHSIDGDV